MPSPRGQESCLALESSPARRAFRSGVSSDTTSSTPSRLAAPLMSAWSCAGISLRMTTRRIPAKARLVKQRLQGGAVRYAAPPSVARPRPAQEPRARTSGCTSRIGCLSFPSIQSGPLTAAATSSPPARAMPQPVVPFLRPGPRERNSARSRASSSPGAATRRVQLPTPRPSWKASGWTAVSHGAGCWSAVGKPACTGEAAAAASARPGGTAAGASSAETCVCAPACPGGATAGASGGTTACSGGAVAGAFGGASACAEGAAATEPSGAPSGAAA
mmetsp:Transcript_112573/g.359574  ORF Transcript_112573/g.359574 Transcript_112573/m.359574 type:complete len:275 (-) Transcript_112573:18-842(-)